MKNPLAPQAEDSVKVKLYELDPFGMPGAPMPGDDKPDYDERDPLRVGTTAALSRIKAKIKDTDYRGEFKTSSLLKILHDSGIKVNKAQLIKLVKREPWRNLISNIKGDHVIFKGDPDHGSDSMEPDDSTETMKKMADRAGKKMDKGLE